MLGSLFTGWLLARGDEASPNNFIAGDLISKLPKMRQQAKGDYLPKTETTFAGFRRWRLYYSTGAEVRGRSWKMVQLPVR